MRRRVLGDRHVDRAQSGTSDFGAAFQRFITEGAWGRVWSRRQLAARERSLVTVALLAAGGHHEELRMHVLACRRTGATAEDLADALLHVAVYAGVPAANAAFRVAERALSEAQEEPDA